MKSNDIEEAGGRFGPVATRVLTVGAQSIGTIAVGALAVGALAAGFIGIGRLVIGRAKIKHLEIGELRLSRLHVTDQSTLRHNRGHELQWTSSSAFENWERRRGRSTSA